MGVLDRLRLRRCSILERRWPARYVVACKAGLRSVATVALPASRTSMPCVFRVSALPILARDMTNQLNSDISYTETRVFTVDIVGLVIPQVHEIVRQIISARRPMRSPPRSNIGFSVAVVNGPASDSFKLT